DELLAFAKSRKAARAGADDASTKSALVSAMLSALETPAADARIAAVAKVACDQGYQPFPGAPACASGRGSANGGGESGGGASGGGGGCTTARLAASCARTAGWA